MKRHFRFCFLLIALILLTACVANLASRDRGAPAPENSDPGASLSGPASPAPAPPEPGPEETPAVPAPAEEPTEAPAPEETPGESSDPPTEPSEVPSTEPPSTEAPAPTDAPAPTEAPAPTDAPAPTASPTPEPPANPGGYAQIDLSSPAILQETPDMGQDYLDQIIFLGDSTTYGMKYYGVLSGGKDTKQVWTPSSGTLTLSYQGFAAIVYPEDGSEITIREAVEKRKPAMMVITLGVNGVSFMGHDDFLSEYTDLVTDIQELSPDTKVIIQSIFPVAPHYEYLKSINNEKICLANTWLLEVAENTGARYLDTISVLMGSDGWLPDAYQNGDGLHLSPEGFSQVLNYIRTHGWT